ncbi:MAG: sensor histidine kinase [Nocardioides sp.]
MPPTSLAPHCPDVYRAMVDAARDALVVVDDDGIVRLVNAPAEAMFGVSHDELIGGPAEVLVPDVFGAARHEWPGDRWQGGRVSTRAVRHDGQEFPAEITLSPLPSPEGMLTCAAIRDVSDQVAIAEVTERIRDELIATISHELRTPLTSILGYTEILIDMGEPAVSEQAARLLAIVRRNAERELKLVEDLLTLAVLGSAGLKVDQVPADIGRLVTHVLADLGALAAQAGVSLVASGLSSLWVIGDPERLTTVIRNLAINAVKFSQTGGCVEVRLAVDGEHGVIAVQDQGGGLEVDELSKVFDALYRTPSAVAAQVPGAGLGLPIVKGIVEAHAGQVQVESQPGLGTTVAVRLPLALP